MIDSNYYKNKIIELIDNISKEIDRELKQEPLSLEDRVSKSSYCSTLISVRYDLQDILEGEQ